MSKITSISLCFVSGSDYVKVRVQNYVGQTQSHLFN